MSLTNAPTVGQLPFAASAFNTTSAGTVPPPSPKHPVSPNQALWEQGDFTRIASTMRESGAAVIDSLGVRSPLRALDLGCGDGTTAVPLAQKGAQVLGVDIARNLIAAGARRAAELGLTQPCAFNRATPLISRISIPTRLTSP